MKAVRTRGRTLPLGIDVGAARVRVALVQQNAGSNPELVAVATRQYDTEPARALADAVAELRTRERRCVFGLSEPHALLRPITFPTMRRGEHERAARYEATALVNYPISEAVVKVLTLGPDGDAVIGVVHKDLIGGLVALAHAAKLRVSAVDNSAFAFRRALPDADAVLDIGLNESRLHILAGRIPIGRCFPTGGTAFTQAIARALGSDAATAERRKHAHGIAGCAESECDALIAAVAEALSECRAAGFGDVRSIALTGNGSRLSDLAAMIERATAVRVAQAVLDPGVCEALPPDVLRAAAPDWCLAYGLALWAAS